MILINVLKIYSSFSLLFILGCSTFKNNSGHAWPLPKKPITRQVDIIPIHEAKVESNGYYLSKDCAVNLVNNVDELKIYAQKLEVFIDVITKYYGDKTEEYDTLEK